MTINTITFDYMTATVADVATAYATAEKADKATMRADADRAMADAIDALNLSAATNAKACRAVMVSGPGEKVAVDYASVVAVHRASLVAAIDAIDAGEYRLPEGADFPTFVDGVIPTDVDADPKLVGAFTIVSGRKVGKGSIDAFVESVFDDVAVDGKATVSMVRAAWSVDTFADYAKSAPSAGAIGAMFNRVADGKSDVFTATDVDGVKAIEKA